MILTREALERLECHWAVSAVPADERKRAHVTCEARLVSDALQQQLVLDFAESAGDDALLSRVATAYEVAAAEGLSALVHGGPEHESLREQARAASYQAFELRRVLRVPGEPIERVVHVLHLSALAYVGDRWADLRRWLSEHVCEVEPPSVADVEWDVRILFRVYEGWLRLFRKDGWNDLHGVAEIIAGLRVEQVEYEKQLLRRQEGVESQALALRLVALYHWARATEQLAHYMLHGQPTGIDGELDSHFEQALKAAAACCDMALEMLLRWLHVAARSMVGGSVWTATSSINSRVTAFVRSMTRARHPLIELLPPQRAALVEMGLLDPASRAIVVDLPTSGGKTLLAQFRILQALNQFAQDGGWIAYVAPTRALVSQTLRRFRRDFSPLGIRVQQVSGGIEIDSIEDEFLTAERAFDVLVSTPEKLGLIVRNKRVTRPLALVVVDEAHNIEDLERGVRIELLLATLKKDCPMAAFLLLMPNVPHADLLARWLGQDAGRSISLGTTAWMPNERVVGLYRLVENGESCTRRRETWSLSFETVVTTPRTLHLRGRHRVGEDCPLNIGVTRARSLMNMTGAMAKVFSTRGTSLAVGDTIPHVWSMARTIAGSTEPPARLGSEIMLVQKFLRTEVGEKFELVELLSKRVGVHHAGLPDEARSLLEWLAEEGHLRVLCATTTVAQGINFPVSSVFMSRLEHPTKRGPIPVTPREFWNLAGRAGRVQQDSVGVVGVAVTDEVKEAALRGFLAEATGALASRLVDLLQAIIEKSPDEQLQVVMREPQWADFRMFVSHLLREARDIRRLVSQADQLLRNTFAYSSLRWSPDLRSQQKADALIQLTSRYAQSLTGNPELLSLADATGFDPEGVRTAMAGMRNLEHRLTPVDWEPGTLFGPRSALSELVGVMMRLPALKALSDLGGSGSDQHRIAGIAQAWVGGSAILDIATAYFQKKADTDAITEACKGIYRNLVNNGVWGLAALSQMPGSGIPWDQLDDHQRRLLNLVPAFLYHGVNTEEAVLMRMNQVPRSIAANLGIDLRSQVGSGHSLSLDEARLYVRSLAPDSWDRLRPPHAALSGSEYRTIWQRLSGEEA